MNSLDTALSLLAATSWRIGLLIVLCLGLRRVLRGRLPAAAVFAVWLVLALALLVPVGIPARWSPFGLVPRLGTAVTPPAPVPVPLVQGSEFGVAPLDAFTLPEVPVLTSAPLVTVQTAAPGLMDRLKEIPASRWATLVWLAGVAVLVVRRAAALMIFSRRLRRSLAPVDVRTASAVERCRELLGIQGEVTSGVTSLVETPALHGILQPRLLMPVGMAGRLSDAELELVVLHELGHVRRRDLLAQTLIHAAAVLHWFNPLAWLAAHAARADCEHACDEFVLGRVEESRREDYGAVLLKVVGLTAQPVRLPAVLAMFDRKGHLKYRIERIARFTSPGWSQVLLGGMLLAGIAVISLTRESVAQQAPATPVATAESNPVVAARPAGLVRMSPVRPGPVTVWTGVQAIYAPYLPAPKRQLQSKGRPPGVRGADATIPGTGDAVVQGTVLPAAMTVAAGAEAPRRTFDQVQPGTEPASVTIRVTADGAVLWQGEGISLDEFTLRLRKYATNMTPASAGAGAVTPQGRVVVEADDAARFSQVFGYVTNEVRKVNFSQVYLATAAGPTAPVVIASPTAEPASNRGLVVIQVSASGRVYWNQAVVAFESLVERLQKGRGDGTITAVKIAGDRWATFQDAVRVIDLVRQAGIANLSVEARTSDSGQAGGVTAVPATPAQQDQSVLRYPAGRGPNGVFFRRANLDETTPAPVASNIAAGAPAAGSTIRLIAIGAVRVQVNLRNADGTDGAVVLANAELRAGESRVVPWNAALNLTASEGANLQLEVNGNRVGVGFTGYRQGWIPAPDAVPGQVGAGGRQVLNLNEVPAQYTVVNRQFIDALGVTDTQEAAKWTPGPTFATAALPIAPASAPTVPGPSNMPVYPTDLIIYSVRPDQLVAAREMSVEDCQRQLKQEGKISADLGLTSPRTLSGGTTGMNMSYRIDGIGAQDSVIVKLELQPEDPATGVQSGQSITTTFNLKPGTSAVVARDLTPAQGNDQPGAPATSGNVYVISVGAAEGGKAYVMGQVKKTGTIQLPLDRSINVADLIALAGGFTDSAKQSGVKVTRIMRNGPSKTWDNLDVGAMMEGRVDRKDALVIQPGDMVNVPMRIF